MTPDNTRELIVEAEEWAEPDNLPADEHDVGYHDGLAAAIRAIEAELGGDSE